MKTSYDERTLSSVCFAICITCLVYWFLGGIEGASFNIGYLKVGGSLAALFGGILLINNQLKDDNKCTFKFADSSETFYAVGKNTGLSKELYLMNGEDTLKKIPPVSNDNNIDKKLKLNTERIVMNKDFILGRIDKENFSNSGFFKNVTVDENEYAPFKLKLNQAYICQDSRNFKITTRSFTENGEVYFDFQLLNSEKIYSKKLVNKDINIINAEDNLFLVVVTQADFQGNEHQQYVQFSVKPLRKI